MRRERAKKRLCELCRERDRDMRVLRSEIKMRRAIVIRRNRKKEKEKKKEKSANL